MRESGASQHAATSQFRRRRNSLCRGRW
jgi:hypothetical protein